jgi:aldehyde dehydrogenase (NAD+)
VLGGVERDAAVMDEEIFGPILPVLPFDAIDEAIAIVNEGDKPLALYVFSSSDATVERVLRGTSSGGACVNDVMSHLLVPGLPFGGVGPSGSGAYHGRWGFDTFSHRKAVLERPTWFEMPVLYPPYKGWKAKLARKLF